MTRAEGTPADFKALKEEEVMFCWRSVADQGQLSVRKLQYFMQETCGEQLSAVQARDLLTYMDANGDGRVGMEDFKDFMSVGGLADTNPKDFMWTPKAKYRREHSMQYNFDRQVRTPDNSPRHAGLQADGGLFKAASAAEAEEFEDSASDFGKRGSPAAPLSASPMPNAPQAPQRRRIRRMQARELAYRPNMESLAEPAETPQQSAERGPGKPRRPREPTDPKLLARIDSSLEKYERASWERLLGEEEAARRRVFGRFAAGGPGELAVGEFHKMLTHWQPFTRWCVPGGLRPADSLGALEYILRRDQKGQGEEEGTAVGGALPPSDKLPYHVWLDLLCGKHRPEA